MTQRFFPRDEYFMKLALREAIRSTEHDDVPVGCVIAHEGEVLAAAPNERELRGDPTAHCEVLALREAAAKLGSWRLTGSGRPASRSTRARATSARKRPAMSTTSSTSGQASHTRSSTVGRCALGRMSK